MKNVYLISLFVSSIVVLRIVGVLMGHQPTPGELVTMPALILPMIAMVGGKLLIFSGLRGLWRDAVNS